MNTPIPLAIPARTVKQQLLSALIELESQAGYIIRARLNERVESHSGMVAARAAIKAAKSEPGYVDPDQYDVPCPL